MKQITTKVTYKVPHDVYCNYSDLRSKCRFCVKSGKANVCLLYNMPVAAEDGVLIRKTPSCLKATAGFAIDVPDEPTVKPKTVMKAAIDGYIKTYKQLINQGYPAALAETLAKEYMIGK